jgi:hypothetical protein
MSDLTDKWSEADISKAVKIVNNITPITPEDWIDLRKRITFQPVSEESAETGGEITDLTGRWRKTIPLIIAECEHHSNVTFVGFIGMDAMPEEEIDRIWAW